MKVYHARADGTEQFGIHIMIDGYTACGPLMTDTAALKQLLRTLPSEMDMHPIHEPIVVAVGPNCKKDPGGLSGFVMIAESHLSFHTFPARHFVTIDVYTCQTDLDTEATIARIKRAFGLVEADVYLQDRGLRYPAKDKVAAPLPDRAKPDEWTYS